MEAIRKLDRGNIKLAIAFVVLNVVDAALTQLLDMKGTLCEANPVMRPLIEQSWGMAWVVKMAAAIFAAFVLICLARRHPHQISKIFIGLIAVMMVVCANNAIGVI